MDMTLSQKFDSVYRQVMKILDGEDDNLNTDINTKQIKINQLIQELEQLTVAVSKLSLFSRNESYDELSGETLKFILLPYLLASLWQIKQIGPKSTKGSGDQVTVFRKNICDISQIYYQDFIQRCVDYKIIETEPPALKLAKQFVEEVEKTEEAEKAAKTVPDMIAKYFDSGDRRQLKIKNFKETKELDQKIKTLEEKRRDGEDLDDETVQELYLSVLRKAVLEANSSLETIIQELNLLKIFKGKAFEEARTDPTKKETNPFGLPFKTFILTKTDLQKNVFGMGYPSLPVMTVEELYEKRREEGIWPGPGGPATSGAHGPPANQEELEAEIAEAAAENDNPEHLERQRNMDEFKDSHRRGWGNRMNRS